MERRRVGTVAAVRRYPVKSMRAETAAEFAVGWNGFEGDRQFAFRKAGKVSGFPWLTGRDLAEMVLYAAEYRHPGTPHSSPVQVRLPDGAAYTVDDPALAELLGKAAGLPVELMQLGRGCFDSMAMSVMTTASEKVLAERHGAPTGLDRFRGNVVIHTEADVPGDERLLGGTLVFEGPTGGARLRADKPIPRCRMITLDPDTAAKDMSVLRTVVQRFDNHFGLYCTPVSTGRIGAGDVVWLER